MVNTFEMKFENLGFNEMIAAKEARKDASMPIRAATLFEMFPFCVLFNVSIIYLAVTMTKGRGKKKSTFFRKKS